MKPTFYEFFAGGGMARAGLGAGWECLFANDIDPRKADAYAANWGSERVRLADVHDVDANDLPGCADLAWASFPCQDLSLAGNGAGLDGSRSGAFWGFHDVISGLKRRRRAPRLLVLENVGGAVTSNNGRDFSSLCRALNDLGYIYGALMLDAVHFVPQSRPRLFIVALRADLDRPAHGRAEAPSHPWTTPALLDSVARLPPGLQKSWRWWRLPPPSPRNSALADLMIDDPGDVAWHTAAETKRLLALMSPLHLAKVAAARRRGGKVVGAIYKRTRRTASNERVQRAEVRFDNVSGCLRTPGGGSSRQTIIVVEGDRVRTRLLSAREAARLMGLPDSYVLPTRYNEAYHLVGDGLVVPVVKFLSDHLLLPLLDSQPTPLVAAE
jgi:DNA (cytosine-5)-methyltransferase 1